MLVSVPGIYRNTQRGIYGNHGSEEAGLLLSPGLAAYEAVSR